MAHHRADPLRVAAHALTNPAAAEVESAAGAEAVVDISAAHAWAAEADTSAVHVRVAAVASWVRVAEREAAGWSADTPSAADFAPVA